MKKKIFITVVLIIVSCISNQLFAQETVTKQRTKSNNTNGADGSTNQWPIVAVKISPTDNGISIVFDNVIVSPSDASTGLPTGKRTHKPVRFNISPSYNTITEVTSTSAMVSGQSSASTKSSTTIPDVSNAPGSPVKGISVKGGRNPGGGKEFDNLVVTNGEFSIPSGLTDGEYELSISFTYQKIEFENEKKAAPRSFVSGRFILDIEGEVCRSIKEKGVSVKSTR